ncbi:MAG: hypothetical protein WCD12_16225 [Candidatus Binatus sp.]|uniref:hypothetical protein n=1 Tax=Candidatus Binatus sp. TaxID=2811406 RepID=UPI003C793BC7
MTKLLVMISITIIVAFGLPNKLNAACGEDCDSAYQSDVQSCHIMYGDDPEDADELSTCIQDARDDYRSCVEDCADQAD